MSQRQSNPQDGEEEEEREQLIELLSNGTIRRPMPTRPRDDPVESMIQFTLYWGTIRVDHIPTTMPSPYAVVDWSNVPPPMPITLPTSVRNMDALCVGYYREHVAAMQQRLIRDIASRDTTDDPNGTPTPMLATEGVEEEKT